MDCKQAEKAIPQFLADELTIDELREFMEHIDKCEECREELSIEFLVRVGLSRLESGNVFDLQKELSDRLFHAENRLKIRENMQMLLYMLEGLVGVAAMAAIALFLFLK